MDLHPDWSAFFRSLISHQVRFLLIGAHALAVHGRPRATEDIDVWVEPTQDNAARLTTALEDFGFAGASAQRDAFAEPGRMATLGRHPFAIDVLTSIAGVAFDDAWGRRLEVPLGGVVLPVLSLQDLVTNKRATGRTKDRLDIALLEEGGLLPTPPGKRRPRRRR